jgi:hypothetical protein
MKQKLIIVFSLLLLAAVVAIIATDLFKNTEQSGKNEYAYDLEKFKAIDSSLIAYNQISKTQIDLPQLNALAIDSSSLVYIAAQNEVGIFDKSLKKLSSFKTDSTIHSIAADNGILYLGIGNHVEVYNTKGVLLKKWAPFSAKGYITSVAVKNSHVYVADAGNRLVFKYNKDGKIVGTYGKKDKTKGFEGFIIPSKYFDLAFGNDEKVWVVNPGMHKVQQFSDEGDLVASWGSTSMNLDGFAGCCNPTHFCILPDGKFVTYEKGLDRIKVYSNVGKFECAVAGPSNTNAEAAEKCSIDAMVHDMAVDKHGDIYVIDASNNLRIYRKK